MPDAQITQLTSDIVAAYIERNKVEAESLPELIRTVHGALAGINPGEGPEPPRAPKRPSSAQIRRSMTENR